MRRKEAFTQDSHKDQERMPQMADFNVYDEVTRKIIASMEAGIMPWRKPWTGSKSGIQMPRRSTGEFYRGINVIMLWLAAMDHGFASAHWFTYKQAQELGAQVRKGEKSSTVIKYGTFEKDEGESHEGEAKRFAYARAYRVFNADQIDGLPEHFYAKPEAAIDLGTKNEAQLDAFFASTKADIRTSSDPRAYYQSEGDFIHMPPVETFHSADGYYSTLAHELTHWTGHKSRLDRFGGGRDRKTYAYEELIAELGNCFLCAQLGIVPDYDQSASYLAGWLEALNKDSRLIFSAAGDAQKAVDWILALTDRTEAKMAA